MSAEAFPLSWPKSWSRTPSHKRERARFSKKSCSENRWRDGTGAERVSYYSRSVQLSTSESLKRLRSELDRLGARYVVISTNVELRQDGLPFSNRREPDDTGVAVYFRLKETPYCLPCDRWDRVADNLAAVAAHIGAMRGMERWGVGSTSEHFAGFKALPPQGGTTVGSQGAPWFNVLGVQPTASVEVVQAAYRALARQHHPDRGGDVGAMAAINRAWEQAQAALS